MWRQRHSQIPIRYDWDVTVGNYSFPPSEQVEQVWQQRPTGLDLHRVACVQFMHRCGTADEDNHVASSDILLVSAGKEDAAAPLRQWIRIVQSAKWDNFADVKTTFGKRVDFVQIHRTRKTVVVFDFGANKYRMIAAVHFIAGHPEAGRVYVLRLFTHAEYDAAPWKDEL